MTVTRRMQLLAAAALILAAPLGACGKKGSLKAPEGQKSQYTYPLTYPVPATVVPPPPGEEEANAGPSFLSPFPRSWTTTTTYGSTAP